MTELLVLIVLGYVIYVDRRLSRLEKAVGEGSADAYYPLAEDAPRAPAVVVSSAQPAFEPEPAAEEPIVAPEPEARKDEWVSLAAQGDEPWQPAPVEEKRPGFSFEEWFGRRLPIWAGGITLAIAGVLIVKLSIEAGLISPSVRVIFGLLFGAGLIAGAELARRFEERVRDVRVRQALSGAGLASLYASILIAANLYGLIPPVAAMVGIAAVTALAMGLAIRFGAPSALLGLTGGLAAPALIGSDAPNVPLLSLYLALAVGGLAALSRNQRWAWLGISALVGGFGWGLMLLLGGALDVPSSISLGLYILLLGVGLPALGLAGGRSQQLQLIAGILAAAQMAALVATGGFAMLNWGLFAVIAVASMWLANRDPKLALLPPVGLAIALLLLGAWPDPTVRDFAIVLAGAALIYAPLPVRRLWTDRGTLLDAAQIAAIGFGGWLLSMLQFHGGAPTDLPLGLLALGLAAALAIVAALGWRAPDRRADSRFAIVSVTAATLVAAATSLLIDDHWIGVAIAAIGLGLLHLGQKAEDLRLEPFAWIFAAAGLVLTVMAWLFSSGSPTAEAATFAAMALLAAMFAWRGGYAWARTAAQALAPALLFGAIAPLLADRFEPMIAPLLLIGLAAAWRRAEALRLAPAMATCVAIIFLWAVEPLLAWSAGAALSLVGEPLLVSALPDLSEVMRQLLFPGVLAGVALAGSRHLPQRARAAGLTLAGLLAGVALHIFYKQVFAIGSEEMFVARGLAERTLWEAILVVAAGIGFAAGWRQTGIVLATAAAGHFAVYTLLLHNPLWAAQQVGSWPLLNLLLPAYGLAFLLTVQASRLTVPDESRPVISAGQMLLILLFAYSTVRQLFHGSLLTDPGLSQAEDIGRSVLAIALGIGFLLWGIARQDRAWRLASLGLMLAAVAKVFLFDASGLAGVTRIASFVALGFSLIGIGWLYARYLPSAKAKAA